MSKLLKQLKARRKALGLTQRDIQQRTGIARQQYQRIESQGNPRLETLEVIAYGLDGEVLFVPKEKLTHIKELLSLSPEDFAQRIREELELREEIESYQVDNPWKELLDTWED